MRARDLLVAGLAVTPIASAHHSSLGLYDVDRIIEIEGVVTEVVWRNPHPRYTMTVVGEDGRAQAWHIEIGGAVTTLRLRGVTQDVVAVGDRIRVAGEASTRGRAELFAHNVLLEDGQEVLLGVRATPRWTVGHDENLYRSAPDEAVAAVARRDADGLFRAWSADLADRESFILFRDQDYPLTAAADARQAQWDPKASPYLGCVSRGMPYLMNNPYPIEFERRGEDIVLRLEMYDAERVIHMNADAPDTSVPRSLYGYSRGRWEGRTLVVETDRMSAEIFDGWDGTPQSPALTIVEYFTPTDAGDRLDYRLVANDPETFTEPLERTRYWIWRPEIRVEPFDCEE